MCLLRALVGLVVANDLCLCEEGRKRAANEKEGQRCVIAKVVVLMKGEGSSSSASPSPAHRQQTHDRQTMVVPSLCL